MKIRSEKKYVIRRRILGTILAVSVLYGVIEVATHLWWTPAGYCWGSMEKCEGGL